MRPWSDFYDMVMPELPGCPRAAIDNALRESAIEFCEQSRAWRVLHPDVITVPGTAVYAFVPADGAAVHAISHATLDGRGLEMRGGETGTNGGDHHGRRGFPRYILGGAAHFTLVPEPDAAGVLAMTVILKPSIASTGIEDLLFVEYREPIVHGALARLMLSPKKPYSNIQLAAYHQQRFIVRTGAAGMRAANSHARVPMQTALARRGGSWD